MDSETFILRGTGSAINVSLGYIPDVVIINNMTDGDKITIAYPRMSIVAFSSGGTLAIVAGMRMQTTSGAKFTILDVVVDTGSFAGGDAAGWFVIDMETKTGTIGSEAAYCINDDTSGVDDVTVAVQANLQVSIDTEAGSETGNAGVLAYVGSSTAGVGITVGSTISEDAKLLFVTAFRNTGGARLSCRNSL